MVGGGGKRRRKKKKKLICEEKFLFRRGFIAAFSRGEVGR